MVAKTQIMKFKFSDASSLALLFLSLASFSQNAEIDYEKWNPQNPPCNIFGGGVYVPATVGGSSTTIYHGSVYGQPKYSTNFKAVEIPVEYVNSTDTRGTQFRFAYNFKQGWSYQVIINAAVITDVLGDPLFLRAAICPNTGSSNPPCNGPDNRTRNVSGAQVMSGGTNFTDYMLPFNSINPSGLSMEITAYSGTTTGANAIRIRKITITETAPPPPAAIFTLSPERVPISCGYSTTQTFTVTNVNNVTGVTYQWYLGLDNGWLDNNGLPAPTGAFIGPASIILTSLPLAPHFSSITVTPLVNGVPQTTLTSVVDLQPISVGIVGGNSTICDGTSAPYYLYNAPPNSSVYWSTATLLPNYGAYVVSVNSPYSSSTTLTKINSGVINLMATVTNGCNQTKTISRDNILVGGYSSTELLSGYTLAYPPCYSQGCTPSPVSNQLNTSGPYGTTVYTGTAYTNCTNSLYLYNSGVSTGAWSVVAGSVASWSYSSGNFLQFYPNGGPGDYVRFRLTVNTSCGDVFYDIDFYPTPYNYSGYYMIAPNPVASELTVSVDESQLQKMNVVKSPEQDIREVVVIDKMGQAKYRQSAGKGTRQLRMNVSNLTAGYYILRIYNGKEWKGLPFIKQ
jgi:hypothetical protein